MKARYFGGAGLTEEGRLFYPKSGVDAEIKRLRGLIRLASGKLLDAGQGKDAEAFTDKLTGGKYKKMNYYAEALEICSKEQDWKSIVIEIAKKHPKAVFDAASVDNWEYQARCLVKEGRKLDAIRLCRSETGKSLRDAKDFVESL